MLVDSQIYDYLTLPEIHMHRKIDEILGVLLIKKRRSELVI